MAQQSKREKLRTQRIKKRRVRTIIWGGVGVIIVVLVGILISDAVRPATGEAMPVMPADHIPDGTEPGPYNTDPPTSGHHYADSLQAGFYHESDLASLPPYPVGNLVHNLEHGYVIFWYNCDALEGAADCSALKAEIQEVMDRYDGIKLIAFPWESLDEPVVMTTWGRMLRFDTFDAGDAGDFVSRNRNRAPEPHAP
jgi:hypothetical protein